MKKKKFELPKPYAEATKDMRYQGTFEVLVPVAGRVKPHKAGPQFDSLAEAEGWMHSPEGQDTIEKIVSEVK